METLPDPRRRGWFKGVSLLVAIAFSFTQVIPAWASHEDLPKWLRKDEGGWLSADQAQKLHKADQELLAFLSTLKSTQERLITKSPGGVEALHANSQLVVAQDPAKNLLFKPTLNADSKVQDGTLLLADGTLQVIKAGQVVRQVDPLGTETFFDAGGRPSSEVAPDGVRSDYTYSTDAAGQVTGITRTTQLPTGALTQSYDSQGRITEARYPDGRVISYTEGRISSVTANGVTYTYIQDDLGDGTIMATLQNGAGSGLAPQIIYNPDGTLQEALQPDGTTIRFNSGIPTEAIAPDGTTTTLTLQEANGILEGLTVVRSDITRRYDAKGILKTLTLWDNSTLNILPNETLKAVKLPYALSLIHI